ncbi:MAG: metallophosphoesterase [Candidatus Methanoperedens sp.]|nr:metallophosphoesterase [Candidatus Methanoperedens sp.]
MSNGKIVVLSDIHFGASFDKTGDDETNTKDLINCLDLIENEIKPEQIVLLGDVFDLWRSDFENAWDEAEKIEFFSRLSEYSMKNDAKIVYVVGNHDHYFKEMDTGNKNFKCFNELTTGTSKKCPVSKDLTETLKLKFTGNFKGIDIIYPHYKIKVKDTFVYFDHGHYAEGAASSFQKWAGRIRKKLIGPYTEEKADFEEIYIDMESNLAAGYSMIYYSRMDDVVREVRDKLYILSDSIAGRFFGNRWVKAVFVVGIIEVFTGVITGFVIGNITITGIVREPGANIANIITLLGMLLGGWVTVTSPYKVISRILNYFGNAYKGEMRGSNIKLIADKMTKEDMSIERKNYTYLDFLEEGHDANIKHYIFGHTHIAGIYKTGSGLSLYNTGSFVKKRDKESNDCTNSFIIIDPSFQEDERIKVYHMSNQEMEPCVFDKDGACNRKCKKN